MRQDQYQKLLPYKMNNDVQGYYGTQQALASKADPRTYQPQPGSKVMTLADITATAKSSGKTTAEVTAAARAKGYTIGGQ
jgi:hypothetical protein